MVRHPLTVAMIVALTTTAASARQAQQGTKDPNGTTAAVATATPPQNIAAAPETPVPPPQNKVSFVTKAKQWAEDHQIMERLGGEIDGWYPRLGGTTRGAGFAIGPGYRTHLGEILVDMSMGFSVKTYKAADVKVRWLQASGDRLEFWTNYRFEDFPQEDFFGIGESSSDNARTSYDFDGNQIRAIGLFKPTSWLRLGSEVGFTMPDIGPGSDPKFPSIEQIFSDTEAAGLLEQPTFLQTTFFADIDYLDERDRPRRGGLYRVSMGFWNDRTLELFDFKLFEANFSQFVPLDADKKHVLLGRLGVAYANNKPGSRVPFYYLPYVGGVDTVRAFPEFRFRDENALWMTVEYDWTLMKWVSLATFIDAGKVAPDWQDIGLVALKHGYGVGARVHSNSHTFARVDVAGGGGEGWRVFLRLGPAF